MRNSALQFIRGGQIFLYSTRMMIQVMQRIFFWSILGFVLLFISLMLYYSHIEFKILWVQYYSQFLSFIGLGDTQVWSTLTANQYLLVPKIQDGVINAEGNVIYNTISALKICTIIYLLSILVFVKFFYKKGEKYSKDKYVSGTRLAKNSKEVVKSVRALPEGIANFNLLKLPLPKRSEFQGFFFHGSTGTGKTQAIMDLLDEIKRLGEPAIIYDKECTIKPYFFDATSDLELNPMSADCANWDLWEECANAMELAAVATYLIPQSVQGSDPFWVQSARTILISTAAKMREREDKSALTLLGLLLTTPINKLQEMLEGTESAAFFSKDNAKVALSIKSILAAYTKSLRFLAGLENSDKPKFSIQKWLTNAVTQQKPGWLYITSRAKYHQEMKPLISMWLGLTMQAAISLPAFTEKRVWFIMDELASLHNFEKLSITLSDIRKFGGCVAVGIQSIAQLKFIYGVDEAMAIADLLNTSIYFRSPRNNIASWVSDDLGEQVIEEVRESQSYGPNPVRDGNSIGSQRVTRKTIDPTSIATLNNLICYVKLLGDHPIVKIKSKYLQRKQIAPSLIERQIDFDALEKLNRQAHTIQHHPDLTPDVKQVYQREEVAQIVATDADLIKSYKEQPTYIKEMLDEYERF